MAKRYSQTPAAKYLEISASAAEALPTKVVRIALGISGLLYAWQAKSDTFLHQRGPLFYMDGSMVGTSTALINEPITCSPLRIVENTAVLGTPVIGGPVYLDDAGGFDVVPGTVPCRVGTVLLIPAVRVVTWLFDGAMASKHWEELEEAVVATRPMALRLSSEEFTIADNNAPAYPEIAMTTSVAVVLQGAVGPGPRNIDLPPSPVEGQLLYVKDGSGTAAVSLIRVHGNGNLFENAVASIDLTSNGTSAGIAFLNGTWRALSGL